MRKWRDLLDSHWAHGTKNASTIEFSSVNRLKPHSMPPIVISRKNFSILERQKSVARETLHVASTKLHRIQYTTCRQEACLVLVSPMAKGGKDSAMRFSSTPPCLAKGLEKSRQTAQAFFLFRKTCACQDPFLLFRLNYSGDSPTCGINAARERDMEMEQAEHG